MGTPLSVEVARETIDLRIRKQAHSFQDVLECAFAGLSPWAVQFCAPTLALSKDQVNFTRRNLKFRVVCQVGFTG